jgi:hypothetical protein
MKSRCSIDDRGWLTASLIAVLIITGSVEAEAQIFRQLGEKFKAVTGQGSAESNDEQTDGDRDDQATQSGASNSAQRAAMMSMFGMGGNIKSESEYVFDSSIKYDIDVKGKRNRNERLRMTLMHREGVAYSAIQVESLSGGKAKDQQGIMITDSKNGVMVMLGETDGGKQSMVIPLATMGMFSGGSAPTQDDESGTMPGFENIGTKQILGKTARGYRLRDQSKLIEFWTTTDVPSGLRRVLLESRNQGAVVGFMPAYMPMGLLLEMTSRDDSSGEVVTMTATEINIDTPIRFVMSQYPRQG